MLKLTANLETLLHRAAEQTNFARTVETGQFHITNESVLDGSSSTTQSERILAIQFKITAQAPRGRKKPWLNANFQT